MFSAMKRPTKEENLDSKQIQRKEKIPGQHSFYAVLNENELYFAGFNPSKGSADFVEDALHAKLFTNKYEVKLRPNERLVEIVASLSVTNASVSPPFIPRSRVKLGDKTEA